MENLQWAINWAAYKAQRELVLAFLAVIGIWLMLAGSRLYKRLIRVVLVAAIAALGYLIYTGKFNPWKILRLVLW